MDILSDRDYVRLIFQQVEFVLGYFGFGCEGEVKIRFDENIVYNIWFK